MHKVQYLFSLFFDAGKLKIFSRLIFLVAVIVASTEAFAQWVNNPAENTRVVFDTAEPVNISSVEDRSGGAFIFWKDNLTGLQSEIRFMHIDSNGNISFRIEFPGNHIEKIDQLISRFQAGENNITFSAYNRRAGIYIYKLEYGDFVETKKMVLNN